MIKNQNKDATSYEDRLRQLLGMQAYVLFTFDKAVNLIMKPLSGLKSDDLAGECWKLFKTYEDSPNIYQEEMYYNDFLRILPLQYEPDFLVRIVYCPLSGVITCHGFSSEPFTTDRSLTQVIKSYRKDHCYKFEDVMEHDLAKDASPQSGAYLYKCNEHTSKNGSIKVPFSNVFLKRNRRQVQQSSRKRKQKCSKYRSETDYNNC